MMNEDTLKKPEDRTLVKIVIFIALGIAVLAIIIAVILLLTKSPRELKKQLSLGQKYLEEMNYDEAIASFERVLEIDPLNIEAYAGLADAYMSKGDYESALAILEKGNKELEGAGKSSKSLEYKRKKILENPEYIGTEVDAEGTESVDLAGAESGDSENGDDKDQVGDSSIEEEVVKLKPLLDAGEYAWGKPWYTWNLYSFVDANNVTKRYTSDVSASQDDIFFAEYPHGVNGEEDGYDIGQNVIKTPEGGSVTSLFAGADGSWENTVNWISQIVGGDYAVHDFLYNFASEYGVTDFDMALAYMHVTYEDGKNVEVMTDYGRVTVSFASNVNWEHKTIKTMYIFPKDAGDFNGNHTIIIKDENVLTIELYR